MTVRTTDFLVIGGGVMGLNLALEARRRHPDAAVTLIEKEAACGRHASGRNSGVLHAGFYYAADSLKARFTRDGNRELTAYCEERGLPINRCGKLVVARDESELAGLDELLRRARVNGVEMYEVTAAEARELEPRIRAHGRALFSPTTSSVDPGAVMASLADDAKRAGVETLTGTAFVRRAADWVETTTGRISAGYVVNAAGLYADRIARRYGFSEDYRILPFKGLYLYAESGPRLLRHIYPVPELRYPFLGVHFTVTVDGRTKIGPTAIPALWRENYSGLGNFRVSEFLEIARRGAGLWLGNAFDFRKLALHELRKGSRRRLVRLASRFLSEPLDHRRWRWGAPGIRAQLVDVRARRLEMDFRFEGDDRSFHVLNAVSPAFTCAMPFTRYLFDRIDELLGHPLGRQHRGMAARATRSGDPRGERAAASPAAEG
ncbi:MAG: L-2-hydroxyglutarate oxidase, partial [Gemmatimonadota bacterium]